MKINFADLFRILHLLLLILLFALLPFIFSQNLISPSQTAKTFIFLYGTIGAIVFLVLHFSGSKNRDDIQITTVDFILCIFFGYLLINRYLLQDVAGFSFRFYELLGLALLYIMIRQTIPKITPWLFLALLMGGLFQAAYGSLQLYGFLPSLHYSFKITGSFLNPGPYAGYLASVFPVALGLWFFLQNRLDLWEDETDSGKSADTSNLKSSLFIYLAFIAGISILLVLPATQSRAAILAVIVSSVYLIFHRFEVKQMLCKFLTTTVRKAAFLSLIGVIMLGSLGGLYLLKKDSADGRILIWKATVLMICENPITGLGYDRFRAGYMKAQAAYFKNHPDDPAADLVANNAYAFNELLQLTAEQGIMGFVLFILLGILIFRTSGRIHSAWLVISKAGIISIFIFSLFSYPAQILPIKLNLILFLALVGSAGNSVPLRTLSIPQRIKPWLKGGIAVVILWGAGVSVLHLNELRNASKTWKLGLDLYNNGNIEQSLIVYDHVAPMFNQSGHFMMNYGKALSVAGEHKKAVQILHKAQNYLNNTVIQTAIGDSYKALERFKEAEQAYLLASYMLPDRFYPKYLLATLYEKTDRWDKAVPLARELVRKNPKIESTAVREIKDEMGQLLERAAEMGEVKGEKVLNIE